MKKGLLMTLIAAAISFTGATASFAAAPVIGGIPDVNIGDNEDNIGTDNNFFVFTNAFKFDTYVTDTDTTVSDLVWSFDEKDHPTSDTSAQTTPYFQVNGHNGMHIGDSSIATNDGTTTNALHVAPPGANELRQVVNGGSNNAAGWASLRDIVFSPTAGAFPFIGTRPSDQPIGTVAAHATGKFVRFFASDGTNVTTKDILVKTIDNTTDTLTSSGGTFTVVQDDVLTITTNGGQDNGWSHFDQVGALRTQSQGYDAANTALLATVASSGSNDWSTFGWITNGANGTQSLTYAAVGTGKIVRAKFFMFASGQTGTASNQVPDLRMRVAHRFAITANLIVQSGGGISGDPLGADIQPSKVPGSPSIYKVDLDSPDTPRLVTNAANEAYLRAFELYDSDGFANGNIAMTEAQIGTYQAVFVADQGPSLSPVTASTGLIKSYVGGASGGDFGALTGIPGSSSGTNSANNAAYVQKYNGLALDNGGGQPVVQSNANGMGMDTLAVETDRLGICAYDMFGGTEEYPRTTATRQLSARVESGKLYKVKFHMTATKNSNSQCLIRLRAKSLAFSWTSTLEINGSAVGGNSTLIVTEFAPGVGNQIPAADRILGDTTGGWYNVLMSSPMDSDIRASQPALAAQDPPGVTTNVASNSVSRRDIGVGVDLIDDFGGVGATESGQIQLDKVQIHKLNAIN